MTVDLLLLVLAGAVVLGGLLVAVDRLARRGGFVIGGLFVSNGVLPALAGVAGALVPPPAFGEVADLTIPQLWIGRLATLVLAGVLTVALLRPRTPQAGQALWAGGVLFCLSTLLSEVYAGEGFPEQPLRIGLAFTAVWVAPRLEPRLVAAWAKGVLILVLVGSAVAFAVGLPGAVVPYEVGVLPGVDFRMQGILPHANDLAPVPVLYLLLERLYPSRALVRRPVTAVAVVLLVLTQSKTAWVAAIVVFALVALAERWEQREVRLAAVLGIAALLGAFTFYSYVGNEQVSSAVDRARTLTGRTQLWTVGVEGFAEQPVWGQGPDFYEDYARRTNQEWAGQAHNQVVEVISERGLVGLAGLVAYVTALCRSALRSRTISRATSLGVVGLLLTRFITETPLSTLGLEHLTVFALLMAWEREALRAQARTRMRSPRTPARASVS